MSELITRTLTADSKKEAIELYKRKTPIGIHDEYCYTITDVHFYDNEFDDPEDAYLFLEKKLTTRPSSYTTMCKCGDNRYAYVLSLPN